MTDKEKLTSYGNRLLALDKKAKAGNLSITDKLEMKAELDAIFAGYKKDFGLPKGVSGNYGMDMDTALGQAKMLGADIQTRVNSPQASKSKDPIVKWEVNENTGNKRPIYRGADGKEYPGEVIKAGAPTAAPAKSSGAKTSSAPKSSKSSGNKTLYGDPEARQILIDAGIDPDIAKNPITVGRQSSTSINKWTNDAERQAWERRNPSYVARWKSINPGVDFDPGNKEHIKDFEDYHWAYSYNGIYNRLQKQHPDWSDEELEKKAKKAADQISFAGKVDVDVNAPDQKWGNWHRNMQELKFDDDNTPAPEATPAEEEETQAAHIDDEYQLPDYAPWWLQDQIALAGDAMDFFRIKKYRPWQGTPDTDFVEPTFYDPTRELAANAEAANLATQTAQAFTNPQQAIAATLAAQAQAARANADVLGRYNSMNVDAANQAENINTQIYNQASLNKAQLATQLFDKYTTANQQFDNSKNMARQKLRQDYINAITNRQNTYNLNTLYPQYAIDPSRGGPRIFRNPRDLDPKAKTEKDLTKAYQEALAIPNTTPEVALQLAKNKLGIQDRDYTNPNGYYTGPYGSMEPFKYPGWTPQQNEE